MENNTQELINEAIPNIKLSIKAKNVYLTIYQLEKETPAVSVHEPQSEIDYEIVADFITGRIKDKVFNYE